MLSFIEQTISNPLFITAQVMGLFTFAFEIIAGQSKGQKKILIYNTIANIFDALQFIFLFAWTGAFLAGFNTARCLLFYWFLAKNKKPQIVVLVICIAIIIINGILTWENYWAITAMLGALISTFALWQTKPSTTRICFLISNAIYVLYCFAVDAWVGGISLIIQDILMLLSIYWHDIHKDENKNNR